MLKRRTMLGSSVAAMLVLQRGACGEPFGRAETRDDGQSYTFLSHENRYAIYVYKDEQITRPYFKDVCLLDGEVPLTRHFPPRKGIDLDDHASFHPGLWMSFGDVAGEDFWRLKARVVHEKFAETFDNQPRGTAPDPFRESGLVVQNRYETSAGKPLLRETCRLSMSQLPTGWLLSWDSTLEPIDSDITFGDQEEMGLGIRLATPLIVKNGGTITNSQGDVNEKGCWGKPATWCDYSGVIDKKRCGLLLLPHPKNFAACAFHARDYGLLVANPFAQQAFGRSKTPARTVVKRGESLRLRFGVHGYALADEKPINGAAAVLEKYVGRAT